MSHDGMENFIVLMIDNHILFLSKIFNDCDITVGITKNANTV